jgi:hypothetical protein
MVTAIDADLESVQLLMTDWRDVERNLFARRQAITQQIHREEIRLVSAYVIELRQNTVTLNNLLDAREQASGLGRVPAHQTLAAPDAETRQVFIDHGSWEFGLPNLMDDTLQ